MKSIGFSSNLTRTMVKISLVIVLGFNSFINVKSNPVLDPPVILEIYFGQEGWSIELLFPEDFLINNLDSMRMTGLYDTAQFVQGIAFTPGTAFFVTQEDFQEEFYINPEADFLHIEYLSEIGWYYWDYYGLEYGEDDEFPYGNITGPVGEESIAWQKFTDSDPLTGPSFWMVKEIPNSIGSNPFQVNKRATFSGYVRDKNDEPMVNIKLYYCTERYHYTTNPTVPLLITDSNGYFYTDFMFCKKYILHFKNGLDELEWISISVEPDSANYFEFKLDTLLTGIDEYKTHGPSYSIYTIPNPSSSQTSFIIESSHPNQGQKGVIKLYSETGYIVDIIPVTLNGARCESVYSFRDKSLATGLYFFHLEVSNKKVASGKMVLQ